MVCLKKSDYRAYMRGKNGNFQGVSSLFLPFPIFLIPLKRRIFV